MSPAVDPSELDRGSLSLIRENWDGLLGDHYSTSAPSPHTRFETVFEEHPSEFLGAQIASHLECLGYLSAAELDNLEPENGWKTAFASWQSDLKSTSLSSLSIELDGEDLERMSELERGIRLLKAICSFEGETSIQLPESPSTIDLPTRIATHRLRTFGFLGENNSIDTVDWGAVRIIEEELTRHDFPDTSFLNLLGDLPELSSRFLQTQHSRVFAFAKSPKKATALLSRYCIKRKNRSGIGQPSFRSAASVKRHTNASNAPENGSAQKAKLRSTLSPGLKLGEEAEQNAQPAELSRFALFLLQARLWTYGYYRGALDGNWGLMSAKALGRFIDEHEKGTNKEDAIATRSAWLQGDSESLVIDLPYLLSYMVSRLDEAAEITARSEIDGLIQVAFDSDTSKGKSQAKRREAEQDLTQEIIAAHKKRRDLQAEDRSNVAAAAASTNIRRRRYFGWRSVFSFMGRVLRWVGNSIKESLKWIKKKIKKILHYATSLLNYIREKTRRAVRLAALGLQRFQLWLTQAPIVTMRGDACVATKSYRDFDTINFTSANVPASAIRAHLDRIDCLNAGFGFLVETALSVWSILAALKYSIVNWLLVAWRTYLAIRRAIRYIDEHEELLDKLEPSVS